jgi:CHAD domain-containing protein
MTHILDAQRPAPLPSKWISGVSAEQPVREAAARILDVRLRSVWCWLPLAAEKSGEDVEYVHQLRIASRRAVEAARMFSHLVEREKLADCREALRRIRRAADGARNWDVLIARLGGSESIADSIREELRRRRADVQGPIAAICQEMQDTAFERRIEELVAAIEGQTRKKALHSLGRQAPRYLKKSLRRFFRAAVADLSNDDNLHELRILAKKLRYTMEPLAPAFEPAFRERLYPQVTFLQDFLGRINDHAMAGSLFGEWHGQTEVAVEKAFLAGMLAAEKRACNDLRQTFLAFWTPDTIAHLGHQFRDYCLSGKGLGKKAAVES